MSNEGKQLVSELLTTNQIFDGRLFRVPDYQRGYSWEERQLEDLVKDIDYIANREYKHYTGTVVFASKEDKGRFDIVDGQQRITSIVILLNEILKFNPTRFAAIKRTFISRDGDFVLELNAETDAFFKDLVLRNKDGVYPENKSAKNLSIAKNFFREWVERNADRIDEIYLTVTEKLGFLCFAPTRTDEIGIMFEVINNRGKALSELEKIKNYFIYFATIHGDVDLKDKINSNWGDILKRLNQASVSTNDEENAFLRNCYIVFYSTNKSKSWNVYDQLKELYPPLATDRLPEKLQQIGQFVDFIQGASRNYAFFFHSTRFKEEYDGPSGVEIAAELKKLRCHPTHASILPLYLSAMSYLYDRPSHVCEILELLERVNFRIYVLPNARAARSDSHQGKLFHLANALYGHRAYTFVEDEEKDFTGLSNVKDVDVFKLVKQELHDFCLERCPEEVFVQSLTVDLDEDIDFYQWSGIRFFLACYEEYRNTNRKESWDIERILRSNKEAKKEGSHNDYLSREHIWAAKNRVQDFPENYVHKRRLGNFVLLGLSANIQLQAHDVEEKVKTLMDKATSSMMQVNDLQLYLDNAIDSVQKKRSKRTKHFFEDVARSVIDQRETELINFALERWKLPDEEMGRFDRVDSFAAQEQGMRRMYYLK